MCVSVCVLNVRWPLHFIICALLDCFIWDLHAAEVLQSKGLQATMVGRLLQFLSLLDDYLHGHCHR